MNSLIVKNFLPNNGDGFESASLDEIKKFIKWQHSVASNDDVLYFANMINDMRSMKAEVIKFIEDFICEDVFSGMQTFTKKNFETDIFEYEHEYGLESLKFSPDKWIEFIPVENISDEFTKIKVGLKTDKRLSYSMKIEINNLLQTIGLEIIEKYIQYHSLGKKNFFKNA